MEVVREDTEIIQYANSLSLITMGDSNSTFELEPNIWVLMAINERIVRVI